MKREELEEKMNQLFNELNQDAEKVGNLSTWLILDNDKLSNIEAVVMSQVCAEVNEFGKPAFTNDKAREAEKLFRLSQKEEYLKLAADKAQKHGELKKTEIMISAKKEMMRFLTALVKTENGD